LTIFVHVLERRMKRKNKTIKYRYYILAILLLIVILVQIFASLGRFYSADVYPVISTILIAFSRHIPFSLGDIFITLSVLALFAIPVYGRLRHHTKWKTLLAYDFEYLLWIYVWFYLAWGLNYSGPHFLQRAQIKPAKYTPELFNCFLNNYLTQLNNSYILVPQRVDKEHVHQEVTRIYKQISDSLKVHAPQSDKLRVKTMLFSNFIASMGVSGYMGPFFCEFNLNGRLLPIDYPATYAHEMAHLLGISQEAEANFYAYEVCTRSKDPAIRFSGYFFVMGYVLRNAAAVLNDNQIEALKTQIRPEVIRLYKLHCHYWKSLYSPTLGAMQDWIYELYLKGNKIESGQKNYSQVVGLLISYEQYKKQI
jgi:hypothetical protein